MSWLRQSNKYKVRECSKEKVHDGIAGRKKEHVQTQLPGWESSDEAMSK